MQAIRTGRFIRYMAILDAITLLLFLLVGLWFLLFLMPLTILGYFAGRRFNKWLTWGYLAF